MTQPTLSHQIKILEQDLNRDFNVWI
ncbi:hypothetical protein [Peribacillus sp. JNUCC41]